MSKVGRVNIAGELKRLILEPRMKGQTSERGIFEISYYIEHFIEMSNSRRAGMSGSEGYCCSDIRTSLGHIK